MRYSIIHHDIRELFELSLHEYVVCDAIYQLSYHYGVTKSNSDMADFLGVDRANISRIKERLLQKGLIIQNGIAWGVTEMWTDAVTQVSVQNQQRRAPSTPSRAPSTKSVLPAHHTTSNNSKEYFIYVQEDSKKPERTTLTGSETFWGLYPKKANKQQFLTEWRKISNEDRAAAIADIPQREKGEQWRESKYIPMPSNFIKDRRWEDEIIQRKSNVFHIK